MECYNCGKKGHGSRYCPNNACIALAGRKKNKDIQRRGVVNGQKVEDILDALRPWYIAALYPRTSCWKGMAWWLDVYMVTLCTVLYPLCNVRIELEGRYIQAVAAVSDTLPTSVLLGTDVSELGKLLGTTIAPRITSHAGEQRAYVVTIRELRKQPRRARSRRSARAKRRVGSIQTLWRWRAAQKGKFGTWGTRWMIAFLKGATQDRSRPDDKSVEREGTSKRQNCMELDTAGQQRPETDDVLGSSAEELRASQEADPTLAAVRKAVSGAEDDRSGNYYKKGGLLYHRRKHADGGGGEDSAVEQLVLPKKFRKAVLNLAHMQCSHSWPSGEAENGGPPIAKVPLAGSAPRCGMLLQGLRRMPEAVQRESLQGTTGSTPRDFCTVRTYSYGHSGATT